MKKDRNSGTYHKDNKIDISGWFGKPSHKDINFQRIISKESGLNDACKFD